MQRCILGCVAAVKNDVNEGNRTVTIPVPHFAGLGRPMLKGADGDPVAPKTRKALAILGYVSRISDLSASREAVADLLWSSATGHRGMQSLRQALKQLKTAEEIAGLDVVKTQGGHIQIPLGSLPTDLACLLDLLNASDSPDFDTAIALWRGDYLTGFEDIDPVFTDWLLIERQRIRDEVVDATLKHLSGASVAAATPVAEAAANFLLHMDPAFEPGHRALIQIYLHRGQRERAEQQLRACERELKELDGVPEQETRDLLRIRLENGNRPSSSVDSGLDNSAGWDGRKVSVSFQFGNGVGNDSVRLPSVSVIAGREETKNHLDGRHLEEEITAGLSAYRAFDLYQSDYFGSEEGPSLSMLQSDELGSYLLRFQHNEHSGNVSIQFEDRSDGRIVFSEIVDPGKWDSIHVAASQIVNRIHLYSQVKLRRPNNNTVYGKWCQAENFMIEFNQRSDAKALELLSEIERQHSAFSMIYSARALIALKNLVYYAAKDDAASLSVDEIRLLTERAVSLDAWQPINQRAHGWALIHAGMPDQASRAFLQAGRLNSVDPINMMSVAEGLAFSGNVGQALEYAENAMKIFSSVPRMFYEYYSHVYFAAEDYENANRMIERAAYNNLTGLTVRVAALIGGGREREAVDLLRRTRDTYGNKYLEDGSDRFMDRLNFFWEPKTRANYEKGVQMVKRFLLGDPTSVS